MDNFDKILLTFREKLFLFSSVSESDIREMPTLLRVLSYANMA